MANDDHGHARCAHDAFGHAAQKSARHSAPPVRTDDDQLGADRRRKRWEHVACVALSKLPLDGHAQVAHACDFGIERLLRLVRHLGGRFCIDDE